MDIENEFGQAFILAFDGQRVPRDFVEYIVAFGIGGVLLFADNYESPEQLRELIAGLQRPFIERDTPLFVCVDQEGGTARQFVNGFTPVDSMATYSQFDPETTVEAFATMGRELRQVGVNLDLAPVADVCPPDRAGAIGPRSFADDPTVVAQHVKGAVSGLQGAGVMACAKHFPGHGATEIDSRDALPAIQLGSAELERHLVPFQAAIETGVSAVMTAHAVYAHSPDPLTPASLSGHWISGVLRGELGFDGLVLSDSLDMQALRDGWDLVEAGAAALGAGTDVLLYYRMADELQVVEELHRALNRGDLDPTSIEVSLRRIDRAKQRWLQPGGVAPSLT